MVKHELHATEAKLTHHGPAAESIEHVKQHKASESHGDISFCDHQVLGLRREAGVRVSK